MMLRFLVSSWVENETVQSRLGSVFIFPVDEIAHQ